MRPVNLVSVDLNLLGVVAAVLRERSATKAAARLFVTQSAVSNALRRARELFGDPLVVREAHGLTPTALGEELLPRLEAWLEEARSMVLRERSFDPAKTTRTFTIACSDSVALMLLAPVLRRLRTAAPNARLRLYTLDRLLAEDALAKGGADLLVGIPPALAAGQSAEIVLQSELACIVAKRDRRVRSRLGLDTYAELPHVDVALFGNVDDRVDRALAALGRTRSVVVAVPHFATVPIAVAEIMGVATIARTLARGFAQRHSLKVLQPPVDLAPIDVRQVWHKRSEHDAGALFLRDVVRRAARAAS